MSGTFAVGILFALVLEREMLPSSIRLPDMVGFIGAYTTFSTLMLESWRLVEAGAFGAALANLVGSITFGLVVLVVGLAVGTTLA